MPRLQPEQYAAFVATFTKSGGDTLAAGRAAGLKGTDASVRRNADRMLINNAAVRMMLADLNKAARTDEIADVRERHQFLTKVMRGERFTQLIDGEIVEAPPTLAERLKATDLLARAQGDYIERLEVSHKAYVVEVPQRIKDAQLWTAQVENEALKRLEGK